MDIHGIHGRPWTPWMSMDSMESMDSMDIHGEGVLSIVQCAVTPPDFLFGSLTQSRLYLQAL